MTQERRTKDRLRDILNGQWARLDEGTRQALSILADEVDGIHAELRQNRRSVDGLRKTVLWVGTTIAAALLSVTGSLMLALVT